MREIPAGVTWEKTGRRTWIATVRREPEAVFDDADYLAASVMNVLGMGNLAMQVGLRMQAANLGMQAANSLANQEMANRIANQEMANRTAPQGVLSDRCPCCGRANYDALQPLFVGGHSALFPTSLF